MSSLVTEAKEKQARMLETMEGKMAAAKAKAASGGNDAAAGKEEGSCNGGAMGNFDITDEDLDNWYDQAMLKEKGIEGYGSEEAKQAYLDDLGDPLMHPMWAEPEDCVNHPMMEAFRAMREEDKTTLELAVMYKDEGNEWLKGGLAKKEGAAEGKARTKSLHEARGCYTHALTLIKQAETEGDEDGTHPQVAEVIEGEGVGGAPDDDTCERERIKSMVISNKALVALHLRNFGEARKDAKLSISIWKYNSKGWYRLCKALNSVRRHDECVAACDAAIATLYSGPHTDAPMKGRKEIDALKKDSVEKLLAVRRNEQERLDKEAAVEERWRNAFRVMGLLGTTAGYPHGSLPARLAMDDESCVPRCRHNRTGQEVNPLAALNEDQSGFAQPVDLEIPTVFLYPQHNQVDLIKAADPHTTLAQHLQVMFPGGPGTRVEWDTARSVPEYVHDKLVVYACLNSAPVISTEEEWVEACREKRDADGHNGTPAASRAKARMTARETKHLREADRGQLALDKSKVAATASSADDAQAFLNISRGRNWLRIDPACMFATVLSVAGMVVPGGVQYYVIFPVKAAAHDKFLAGLKKEGVSIGVMQPE